MTNGSRDPPHTAAHSVGAGRQLSVVASHLADLAKAVQEAPPRRQVPRPTSASMAGSIRYQRGDESLVTGTDA